jgi:hypothetical protein
MTGKTENEIIVAAKELHEIIAAAKELGIKLTNANPGSDLWEEAWRDHAKHAKLCVDEGRTDECTAVIEDANAPIADAAPASPSTSETSAAAADCGRPCDLRGCKGAPLRLSANKFSSGAVRKLLESVREHDQDFDPDCHCEVLIGGEPCRVAFRKSKQASERIASAVRFKHGTSLLTHPSTHPMHQAKARLWFSLKSCFDLRLR